MTEVAFHFNVADKVRYACRLLHRAHGSGMRVGVVAERDLLRALDIGLWSFSPLEFVAHCDADAAPALRAASPIVLAGDCADLGEHQILMNLGEQVPAGFERFERLIELVSPDPGDRKLARDRWRHYADRGYRLVPHDSASEDLGRGN